MNRARDNSISAWTICTDWRRAILFGWLGAVIVVACATSARGQMLDLGEAAPPPELTSPTVAEELMALLAFEADQLRERSTPPESAQRAVIQASIHVRTIAADLLRQSGSDGTGNTAALMGETLAAGRADIDRLLARLLRFVTEGAAANDESLKALQRFNRDAARLFRTLETSDVDELDVAVPTILASLGEMVSILSGSELVSHWPITPQAQLSRYQTTSLAGGPPPPAALLAERLDTALLGAEAAQTLTVVLIDLQRGSETDLSPRGLSLRRRIDRVLGAASMLASADWLEPPVRDVLDRQLDLAVAELEAPTIEARLEDLEVSAAIVERIAELSAGCWVELDPVRAALQAAWVQAQGRASTSLRALLGSVDRMFEYCGLGSVELPRDLRTVYLETDRAYRDAETALLEDIVTIASQPAAAADPAFQSLLADQRQYLDDLRRIRNIPGWINELAALHAECGNTFFMQSRRLAQELVDPNRRPDAVRAMAQFERQLDLFRSLPAEAALRSGEAYACDVTGQWRLQLLAQIDRQRRRWAKAWGEGDAASPAAQRLMLLAWLGERIDDASILGRLGTRSALLNRWAGWELPTGSLDAALVDLRRRLNPAIVSAVRGDSRNLRRQLEAMERDAATAILVAQLLRALESPLQELPPGAAGTLGQLLFPPTSASWARPQRAELALICRYVSEAARAGAGGATARSVELDRFVNQRALRLLESSAVAHGPLPAIPGWEGGAGDGR